LFEKREAQFKTVITDKPVVLSFWIEILEMLVFKEGGNPQMSEKIVGARTRTNNKLNPHEPSLHQWEVSAVTTNCPLTIF